jgi:hypothetical protein
MTTTMTVTATATSLTEVLPLEAPSDDRTEIGIRPSDLPAAELPDYEPTAADLFALAIWNDDDVIDEWIASTNTQSAVEARHQDLLELRAQLPVTAFIEDDDELADNAAECAA